MKFHSVTELHRSETGMEKHHMEMGFMFPKLASHFFFPEI